MLTSRLKPCKKGYQIIGTNITIRKRPGVENWEACIYIKEEKRQKAISTRTKDIDDAIIFAIKLQQELEIKHKNGMEIFSSSFEVLAKRWLEHAREKVISGAMSTHMLVVYESIIRVHLVPFFGKMSINAIIPETIQSYIPYLKSAGNNAAVSFRHHRITLSQILKYAQEQGIYKHRTIPKIEVPKFGVKKELKRTKLSDNEVETILNNIDTYIDRAKSITSKYNRSMLKAIIFFMLSTGCRTNDLKLLSWGDFEFRTDNTTIRKVKDHETTKEMLITLIYLELIAAKKSAYLYVFLKGKKRERWVPVDPRFTPCFVEWLKLSHFTSPNDLVFCGLNGKWNPGLAEWFKEYLKFCSIPDIVDDGIRTPYSLRHTFITKKLIDGISPFNISLQCGTSVREIQQTYCHMLPEDLFNKIFMPINITS